MIRYLTCLAVFLATTCAANAVGIRHDTTVSNYNAIANSPLYIATGSLTSATGIGTGLLVSPTQVLTAAHNVADNAGVLTTMAAALTFDLGPNYTGSSATPNVASISIMPQWGLLGGQTGNGRHYDIAVITLSTPITGVAYGQIAPVNLMTPASVIGRTATFVGYGVQGTGNATVMGTLPGANERLGAQNVVGAFAGAAGFELFQSDFDSPAGTTSTTGSNLPLLLEGTTNSGDSGGPLFIDFTNVGGSANWTVGVLNGGINPFGTPALYGDLSEWAPLHDPLTLTYLAGFGITPVPEPTTILLFCAVASGVGYPIRRKLRKA